MKKYLPECLSRAIIIRLWNACPMGLELGVPSAGNTATASGRMEVNMKALEIIFTVLQVISCVALILIVLLQSGKESGLSGAIRGGGDTYLSKSKRGSKDRMLASVTKWMGLAFAVFTLALNLI